VRKPFTQYVFADFDPACVDALSACQRS
jgi:hypothetical protein